MKTRLFDALLGFSPENKADHFEGALRFQSRRYPARYVFYPRPKEAGMAGFFAQVSASVPFSLKWKDRFEVMAGDGETIIGPGTVLDPLSPELGASGHKKRTAYLQSLAGDEKGMVLALCRKNGIEGLRELELLDFCRLSLAQLDEIGRILEGDGQVKILSFSPLFLVSQESFDFLCEKILKFLAQFHKNNPGTQGVSLEKIQKRFDLSPKLLSLALRLLEREGKVRDLGFFYALSGFEAKLTASEEDLLKKIEEMYLRGEFQSVSQDEIREKFGLPPSKAQKLLTFLVQRKKVVQGKDGFMLHSAWLEEIIRKVRALGGKELSVSDFKNMTGLSRKYAIPLLELLDEMGVTRRKGPHREIL
jgi:selenocysteine-specific elongation factor